MLKSDDGEKGFKIRYGSGEQSRQSTILHPKEGRLADHHQAWRLIDRALFPERRSALTPHYLVLGSKRAVPCRLGRDDYRSDGTGTRVKLIGGRRQFAGAV